MKPGFLNDPKAAKRGLGPLQDPRTATTNVWRGPPTSDSLGAASKEWRISKSPPVWGKAHSGSNISAWGRSSKDTTKQQKTKDDDTIYTSTMSTLTPLLITSTTTSTSARPDNHNTTPNPNSNTSSNPYAGQSWLPNKTVGVPKAALNAWYMMKPRKHQCSKDQYTCWNNGGRAHEMKFTCVFVCPLTGEIFFSGEYGNANQYTTVVDDNGAKVVWYAKKALAEHGAASRAYDCFSYREHFGTDLHSIHLGTELPYLRQDLCLEHNQPPPPPYPVNIPIEVEQLIQQQVSLSQNRMEVDAINADAQQGEEAHNIWENHEVEMEREGYRMARGGASRNT